MPYEKPSTLHTALMLRSMCDFGLGLSSFLVVLLSHSVPMPPIRGISHQHHEHSDTSAPLEYAKYSHSVTITVV